MHKKEGGLLVGNLFNQHIYRTNGCVYLFLSLGICDIQFSFVHDDDLYFFFLSKVAPNVDHNAHISD